jgi:hypothetical protein
MKRHNWKVLKKGTLNSPTLCQKFVQQPLKIIHRQFPQTIIHDEILLADSNEDTLEKMFKETQRILPYWGLQTAPEKLQRGNSLKLFGFLNQPTKN